MQSTAAVWLCLLTLVQAFMPVLSYARDISFRIMDQHGKPVPDAVIFGDQETVDQSKEAPAIMDQVNKTFSPHVLTIQPGRQVNFPNSDHVRHHVYSFSKPKVFEIKLYAHKPEEPITFNQAGIVVLGCNIHDAMVGYIVISNSGNWGQSNADGETSVSFKHTPERIRLWHPSLSQGVETIITLPLPPLSKDGIVPLTLELTASSTVETGFRNQRFKQYGR